MLEYQVLYKKLHDFMADYDQEQNFIDKIRDSINELICDIPQDKEIVLRPYGATSKWLIDSFDFGNHKVSCFDPQIDTKDDNNIKLYSEYSFGNDVFVVNTSYNWRTEIVSEFIEKKINYKDLFAYFEKNNIYLNTNPEEYKKTTHAIPNYFYCQWKKNNTEENLRKLILSLIEAYDFVLLEEICNEMKDCYCFVNTVLDLYKKLKREIEYELTQRKNMNDIIIHWLDAVPHKWRKYLPRIEKLSSQSLSLENTYSCTPYTHQTLRAMISGLLPLDDFNESMKLIDENSIGIQWLEERNYFFKQIGHDGSGVSSCIEKYTYNEDKNVTCNYIYWKCIEEMLSSDKPVFLIVHAVVETHQPMICTKLEKPIYNLSSENFEKQRDISYKYIDERVDYYRKMFGNKIQLILSDHGEHISRYPERYWLQNKLHTWCIVVSKNVKCQREDRLFPYYNFMILIEYLLNLNETKYDQIFEEYILFQDTDYYNHSAIDDFIKEGLAEYAIAYSGILDGKFKYVVNSIGQEFFYRIINDVDFEIDELQGEKECANLKKLIHSDFPDVSKYEKYKYSKKLYEELKK